MDTKKTPWHIWTIGIVSLLWNAMGAMDFVMSQMQVESYMAGFSEEQLAYFTSFPVWVIGTWGIAVLGAVLGSILLLLRSKVALPVFWIALVAMVATAIHNYILGDVKLGDITGTGATIFSAVIFIVSVLLVFYSNRQVANGNLR